MHESYHGPSADDYIRRIDRLLIVIGTIAVMLAVGLILQLA
jgi:hypothetical protein